MHHGLEHGAENIRINVLPNEATELNEEVTRLTVKLRGLVGSVCGKEAAIDIREDLEVRG